MGGFPLDSWSATSVHVARGNMRLGLKILLDLGARALAIPNRAPPLKRSLCEKQRTATPPSLAALASGSFSSQRASVALRRRCGKAQRGLGVSLTRAFGSLVESRGPRGLSRRVIGSSTGGLTTNASRFSEETAKIQIFRYSSVFGAARRGARHGGQLKCGGFVNAMCDTIVAPSI